METLTLPASRCFLLARLRYSQNKRLLIRRVPRKAPPNIAIYFDGMYPLIPPGTSVLLVDAEVAFGLFSLRIGMFSQASAIVERIGFDWNSVVIVTLA